MSDRSRITFSRTALLAWRGWTKACPRCGARGLFNRWFTLESRCPRCGVLFEREEGYWTGAMGANIIVTELSFVSWMILALVLTWPEPPVREIIIAAIGYNVLFPMFFYPFSKTVWMAFDWAFNPTDEALITDR